MRCDQKDAEKRVNDRLTSRHLTSSTNGCLATHGRSSQGAPGSTEPDLPVRFLPTASARQVVQSPPSVRLSVRPSVSPARGFHLTSISRVGCCRGRGDVAMITRHRCQPLQPRIIVFHAARHRLQYRFAGALNGKRRKRFNR